MDLGLLLADGETLSPVAAEGLAEDCLGQAPRAKAPHADPAFLISRGKDPNKLAAQGWGVILPEEGGAELLKAMEPLLAARAQEQRLKRDQLRTYTYRKDEEPKAWIEQHLGNDPMGPLYLLLLGDLDRISLELQSTLCNFEYCPGRLAFDRLEDYAAYADKVLSWERGDREQASARVVMATARTETDSDSPDHGYRNLMKPARDLAAKYREDCVDGYDFSLEEVGGRLPVSLDRVLDAARNQEMPTLLMTMSHGIGHADRAQQGQPLFFATPDAAALSLAPVRTLLTPTLVSDGAFLPGGVWFLYACFGAATPRKSSYWHWLKLLSELPGSRFRDVDLESVLKRLPQPGQAPFVAAVPKAALANPLGPLAVIGHADLAWSCGYKKLAAAGQDPLERLLQVPSLLADPSNRWRVGSTTRIFRQLATIDSSLCDLQDLEQQARAQGKASDVDQLAYGQLWMQRQDLANFLLLGDPAARLPIRANS